jgi:hypothetical protein
MVGFLKVSCSLSKSTHTEIPEVINQDSTDKPYKTGS